MRRLLRSRVGDDRGSATVESAIAVCAVVVALALALGGLASVSAQLRCIDAAREAARLVARGDRERAEQAASRIAPSGAHVAIQVRGDEVTVRIRATATDLLPGLTVGGEAVAVLEPGAAGAA